MAWRRLQSVLEQFCFQLKLKQWVGVREGAVGLGVVVGKEVEGCFVLGFGSEDEDEEEEEGVGEGMVLVDGSIR